MYDSRITHGQFSVIYSLAVKSYVFRSRKRWTERIWDGLCPVAADNRYCSDVIGHRLTVTCPSSRAGQFQSRNRKFRLLLPPRPELKNTLCARPPCCYFTVTDNYVKEVVFSPAVAHNFSTRNYAASRWGVTAEAQVLSQSSPCEICGRLIGTVTGLSPVTAVSLYQYHCTIAPSVMQAIEPLQLTRALNETHKGHCVKWHWWRCHLNVSHIRHVVIAKCAN